MNKQQWRNANGSVELCLSVNRERESLYSEMHGTHFTDGVNIKWRLNRVKLKQLACFRIRFCFCFDYRTISISICKHYMPPIPCLCLNILMIYVV